MYYVDSYDQLLLLEIVRVLKVRLHQFLFSWPDDIVLKMRLQFLSDLDSFDGGPGCCISLPVSTERARLCDDAMGLGSLLFATLLGVAGRVGSVLASQSSRISKRVTGTQSLSISAKLMVGKRNTQASRMYVPAHVGCTL